MTIGVYKITNVVNGKYYVGSSFEIEKRFWRHINELEKGVHHCIHLQRAWNKYGVDAFIFEIAKECDTEAEARDLEQTYLDTEYDTLYNTSKVSSGGDLISYHPNRGEIVAKMAESLNERYNSMSAEERAEKYGSKGMYGKHHSEESRNKMSEAAKGNQFAKGSIRTEEQKARLAEIASQRTGESNGFFGKHHSEETKRKIAESRKGIMPPNTKEVDIEGVTYPSASKAAKALGVATATVLNRIKSDKFPTWNINA